ncbi:hypothetical protein D0809_08015 [Flavobacterium circumlabens]|uniref:Uncharacterized protein n=1 Tax=Flavobacterium circumlabens TaxID=2133765 RepID=A0A4Y7UF69_9FLAO|nr:hypothetical protein D0809_08015 [Flavobacterium circumlabens]
MVIRESDDLYNIKFKLNSQIIDILPKINKTLNKINIYLFYWFDIDKSVNESFSWKYCPVTNDLLTDLNIKSNNSLICSNCFLVFPKY